MRRVRPTEAVEPLKKIAISGLQNADPVIALYAKDTPL